MIKEGFLIGASTAAHQVEGNNIHSDYWAMEHMATGGFNEPSGDAVDHYNRYEEDIKMMADAGLNAYRFSIEWARIEPEQGQYDESEIEHYRKVIKCCLKNGIEPVVTMHHFTSPKWLISKGGWENPEVVDWFANYCKYVIEQLGEDINYVCTINEANMRIQVAAIAERFKRQMMARMAAMKAAAAQQAPAEGEKKESLEGVAQVGMNFDAMMAGQQKQAEENMAVFGTEKLNTFVSPCTPEGDEIVKKAHVAAREAMKSVKPALKVGITLSLHDIQVQPGGEANAEKEYQEEFGHYIDMLKDDDFFGLQNYTRSIIGADGIVPSPEGTPMTQMDYENYPQALEHVIRRVHDELPNIPIMITENGIGIGDDEIRQEFIKVAMQGVKNCVDDGINVIGYCHWSLMDNFEWQKGYMMTFGLCAVDRATQKRYPKPSLALLGSYAK